MRLQSTPRDQFRLGFFATVGTMVVLAIAWVLVRFCVAILEIAAPFVVGLGLALLLDPVVHRIQGRGMKRMPAVGIVFGVFFLILVLCACLVIPAVANEASSLAKNGPVYLGDVKTWVNGFVARHHHKLAGMTLPSFDALINEISNRASTYLSESSGQLMGYVMGSVAFLINFIITLIVSFYFLADLDRLRARLVFLLPERGRPLATRMGQDVGKVFADYLRGLLVVCILFGLSTTAVLYILACFHHGVAQYALIIGAIAGILYAIPYLGALTTAILAFIVAYATGGLGFGLIALASIIVLEQVYDNVVTPKVVGEGVGLHPVMALFALVLGAHLFGIWGMLVSVPVAASFQIILFRLFPKLTTPTPGPYLIHEGVPPSERESAKYMAGEDSPTEEHKDEQKQEEKNENAVAGG